MGNIRLGIVGLGKIARDQHLGAIEAADGIELTAVASRNAQLEGVHCFRDIGEMLASGVELDAISLCTPPQGRFAQAKAALEAGKHLMLEKPPGTTLAEVFALEKLAREKGVSLYATWHSRAGAAVEQVRELLAKRTLRSVSVIWKEDVRYWHPGQAWIWEPGGLGVFDPGINALSIVTHIMPDSFHLTSSDLFFPENRAAPIAANLKFETAGGIPVTAEMDWRQTGPQTWDIRIDTEEGPVALTHGGGRVIIDGEKQPEGENHEYRRLYERFVELVQNSGIDTDFSPLVHVADAFMLGRRHAVEAFED
ncbi:gfo/Idh/MocA family oxidoreductase [Rhizobiales bacterium RZME27]|jgi:D-galactose 1-dehydrogenase|uniref:Gfo/Idh/MocA family oxidoreductase n=1 Tax=Endobacterium cereale TaxID=2663029 RepID=A0A6A8A8L0_9HYPH|nr:Gfo/Idh/MocA family oxidoreductase [Endobacterium cereale]MEB2844552.1 Gfo/Idh/MocA family oxidoreductase [Endobacterium cereale]MQY45131.1 gfo/Idh/MocA family oxidoreductase [Endobacterium cereale]